MFKTLRKGLPFIVSVIFILVMTSVVSAHSLGTMGGSQWVIGKNNIHVTMEMSPDFVSKLKGIKEKHPRIGRCSAEQLQQMAAKVFQPYIAKKLSVWINGRKFPITVEKLSKNGYLYDLILSINNIGYSIKKTGNSIKIDYRLFFAETDGLHINVATIKTADSDHDETQNEFTVDSPVWEEPINMAAQPVWANMIEFIILGIKHILTGYDHILFLLALIVIGLSLKDVLRIISAFTVAHSITLFLAAMNLVRLNSRFVESMIALSICYIALENLLRRRTDAHAYACESYRWMVAFGFGLIHGFGFASILQDLIISKSTLIPSVLSFNAGVEIGQLMIFFVTLPVLNYLRTRVPFRKVTVAASVIILALGSAWLIERVFSLKLL